MSNLQKVRGRVKAKDLKQGKIYYRSGIGGVEQVSVDSKPFLYKDKDCSSTLKGTWWVMMTSLDVNLGISREQSLGDMGISCLGDYKNSTNRLFKTKNQAENWQVYLELSGLNAQHNSEVSGWQDYDWDLDWDDWDE